MKAELDTQLSNEMFKKMCDLVTKFVLFMQTSNNTDSIFSFQKTTTTSTSTTMIIKCMKINKNKRIAFFFLVSLIYFLF